MEYYVGILWSWYWDEEVATAESLNNSCLSPAYLLIVVLYIVKETDLESELMSVEALVWYGHGTANL